MEEIMTPPDAQAAVPAPASASVWQMYRAMVGVGLMCGVLIVGVFQWTRPIIERNKAEALQRAIFDVLPAATSSATFRLEASGHFEATPSGQPGDQLVYAGYDSTRNLVGVAIEAQGMGYQDVIRVLYGYSFDKEAIIGIRVLDSKETPGLGDRIESDPEFRKNFESLDVSLSDDPSQLRHAIEAVKHGEKQHAWQVDGITGATISSVAIANLLNRSASWWIPRIRPNWNDLREADPTEAG
jgi:electron transport complex protein RnfG